MTKDEALAAWDDATNRLAEVKARHRCELALAKREFATARDAFIDASADAGWPASSPLSSPQRN